MIRMVCFILLLCVFSVASIAEQQFDISNLTYEELLELQKMIDNQIQEDETIDFSEAFKEIEPYLCHIGEILDGTTLSLDATENANMDNISILNIEGKVSYGLGFLGEAFYVAGTMRWTSHSSGLTQDDFKNICRSVLEYYKVDVENFDDTIQTLRCSNEIYSVICDISEYGLLPLNGHSISNNIIKANWQALLQKKLFETD